jgi:hypothetical protein
MIEKSFHTVAHNPWIYYFLIIFFIEIRSLTKSCNGSNHVLVKRVPILSLNIILGKGNNT